MSSPEFSWDLRLAFLALLAARLLLELTNLPLILQHEHQLSSPLTSYSNRMYRHSILNAHQLVFFFFSSGRDISV